MAKQSSNLLALTVCLFQGFKILSYFNHAWNCLLVALDNMVTFNGSTWLSFSFTKTSLWTHVTVLLTHIQPTVILLWLSLKRLCHGLFLTFYVKKNKHYLFLTLYYCGLKPNPMMGEGFQFPVHFCSVSNTTWSKLLMERQLLYFKDERVGKHTERAIVPRVEYLMSSCSPINLPPTEKARVMSPIHTVLYRTHFHF